MAISHHRIKALNSAEENPRASYVLYWCVAQRRMQSNFALDFALDEAKRLSLPLLILEPLRLGYRWSSERQHTFIVQGMRDNASACAKLRGVYYYPYVEAKDGEGQGLLEALAQDAALVVTDYAPYFFVPRMQSAAAKRLKVPLVAIDSNGIVPIRALNDRWSSVAHSFRRRTRDWLPEHIERMPRAKPFEKFLADAPKIRPEVLTRWPAADFTALLDKGGLAQFAYREQVPAVREQGGTKRAQEVLNRFVNERLPNYLERRVDLDNETCSGLSPWLHYGHISVHQVFQAIAAADHWDPSKLAEKPTNQREGWWGMGANAEAFMDELITWRELGFHTCLHRSDYDSLESIPDWAKQSLAEHHADPRPANYSLEQLARAETYDEVWNAAQRQLLEEGRIHNAIRMVWGKLVLAWMPDAQAAFDALIELNNRYALDGRDPNSYSGVLWCFGRHDRAWGPERPIYGKVRYMTSESFQRKAKAKLYLERWSKGMFA